MMSRNSGNHNSNGTLASGGGNRNRKHHHHRNSVSSNSQLQANTCDCLANNRHHDSLDNNNIRCLCCCNGDYVCESVCHESVESVPAFGDRVSDYTTEVVRSPDPNGDCFLRPNRLIDNFYGDNLHRFAIYENLCRQCGFGVGCGCSTTEKTDSPVFNSSYDDDETSENIYENVCETCSFIYSGERCELCQQQKQVTKKASKQLTKFAEILGNLRQRIRDRAPKVLPASTRPKLEIVHTIGDVFKTNKTFDLSEIVRLKQQTADTHIYGKLRNSDEQLSKKNCTERAGIKTSASDSNFLANIRLSFGRNAASTNTLFGSPANDPIYDNLPPQKNNNGFTKPSNKVSSASEGNLVGLTRRDNATPDTHILNNRQIPAPFDIHIDSLKHWMTSLRRQTHDYNDDFKYAACTVKCIPSMYVSCCGRFANEVGIHDNSKYRSNTMDRADDLEVWTRVNEFRANFIENHSKRNAVYFKRGKESETEPIYVRIKKDSSIGDSEVKVIGEEAGPAFNGSEFSESAALKEERENNGLVKMKMNHATTTTVKVLKELPDNNILPFRTEVKQLKKSTGIIPFENGAKHRYYITQLALSTGLHQATLLCDKRLHAFVKGLISVQKYSNGCNLMDFQRDLNDMFIIFHKTHGETPLTFHRIPEAVDYNCIDKVHLNDFALHSHRMIDCDDNRKQIGDFEKISNVVSADAVIEDYQRPNGELALPKKTLNDFEVRKVQAWGRETNYSSTASGYKEDHEIKIRNVDGKSSEMERILRKPDNGDAVLNGSDENIYQPIWKFQTVGSARESDVSFVSEYYTANECFEEAVDVAEWEVAEEFAFATERNSQLIDMEDVVSCEDNRSIRNVPHSDPYHTVCILYCQENDKYNKIIYDYNGNNVYGEDRVAENMSSGVLDASTENNNNYNNKCGNEENNLFLKTNLKTKLCGDSVLAWQHLIRSAAYMEDEEDLMLPESFLLENLLQENNQRNQQKENIQNNTSPMVSSNESLSDEPICKFSEEKYAKKTDARILSTTPPPDTKVKRDLRFLNKLQYRRFDVSKNSKKEDGVQGLFYKNLDGKLLGDTKNDMKKSSSNLVFGVDLNDVEKDEKFTNIPKFVVECIKIIELEENIQTNGIYRASGKKESIDKLKKKMNESKLRRGTKYVVLKDEDIHTVTGALKQFLRELKTDLIPIDIVKRLSDDLERVENLTKIKAEMKTIDFLPRESLKYLLKHLIFVDRNSEHNLMNASIYCVYCVGCLYFYVVRHCC